MIYLVFRVLDNKDYVKLIAIEHDLNEVEKWIYSYLSFNIEVNCIELKDDTIEEFFYNSIDKAIDKDYLLSLGSLLYNF